MYLSSFGHVKTESGPRVDPWGTPVLTTKYLEIILDRTPPSQYYKLMCCFSSFKNDDVQLLAILESYMDLILNAICHDRRLNQIQAMEKHLPLKCVFCEKNQR